MLRDSSRVWTVAIALLVAALLFGGATRVDVLAHFIPRALAIVTIAILLWRGQFGLGQWTWMERIIWGLLLAVPLLQLIPLPWDVWTALPGREYPRDILAAVGQSPSAGISQTPDHTWNSFFALLPALAMYALARQANVKRVRLWLIIIIAAGLISALLGLMQMAGGTQSSLRFYTITNADSAVGLFSNANHHATFLAVIMLMIAYWYYQVRPKPPEIDTLALGISLASATLIAGALFLTMSQAGLAFLTVTLLVYVATLVRGFGFSRSRVALVSIVGVALVATIGFFLLTETRLAEFTADRVQADGGRLATAPTLWRMIQDNWLVGSGLGSFDPVYRSYEAVSQLSPQYLNHAHNDYAELLIEAGLPAIAGLLLFFGWWLSRAFTLRNAQLHITPANLWMARMALAATAIMLAHSLVDYPLRGAAMSVIFAVLCAILARATDSSVNVVNRSSETGLSVR